MSTAYRYKLDPIETPGYCHVGNKLTQESADVASLILQSNRTAYHVFTTDFDKMGAYLHNHIVHHVTALWALGADEETMIFHKKNNENYQLLPRKFPEESIIEEMKTEKGFRKYRGSQDHFLDYVTFFEREIDELGYQEVLQKYVVGGGEIADDILARMYHGYVHSLMYLGQGLEFKQLPLVAEALAQAVSHNDMYYNDFLKYTELQAQYSPEPRLSLLECLEACREDPVISTCSSVDIHHQVVNGSWKVEKEMIRDYVCGKAFKEMATVCARYRVDEDDVERATAELINTAVYMAAAAQRPPHQCRYDFFLIHGSNSSIWQTALTQEPSLTPAQKARLIEYTGRVILMLYAGMGSPALNIDWLLTQQWHEPGTGWDRVIERVIHHKDDGHMAKLVRVIRHAEEVSRPYEDRPEFPMKSHMFLPAAQAAIDSGSDKPMSGVLHFDFVRGSAFPEAWAKVPRRGEVVA
ncbi:hypothetical protein BGW36DRAFT_426077 [Talaromyces proteolyticus]|uniref:HypA protein n=1 Tax=Talaromyces proteolyticus TaxID=1131652 RepID=A0AAD4PWP6_9EURO|nr:uncharacterized protein BGW36DRAFT_426077 [Talaromyces proteolyticus]KAH8698367.1 hypothetical protein BGW36DRAFT_426077 [Talaromyces proteolyticus]